MKNLLKCISMLTLILILKSCSGVKFYQVYETSYSDNLEEVEDYLVYEDQNCKLYYDLWSNKGEMSFKVENKTDYNLYLDLSNSYFILNGIANDYFKNRIFTQSEGASTNVNASRTYTNYSTADYFGLLISTQGASTNNVGASKSRDFSVSVEEQPVIVIPAKTAKYIGEYNISKSPYRDCDLYRFPYSKQIESVEFTKSNSPIAFSNSISYMLENSEDTYKLENSFFVTRITNYPEKEIIESDFEEVCGKKTNQRVENFKISHPSFFYLEYTKPNKGVTKH